VGAGGVSGTVEQLPTLDDLKIEITQSFDLFEEIEWHKERFSDLTIVGFALTVFEQIHSIHALCELEKYFDAKILLRSSIEHFLEISLLCEFNNEKYIERLKLEFNHHQVKTLNAAQSGNPYASSIMEKLDVKVELEELDRYKEEIEKRGGKKITLLDRFKSAGHGDLYDTVYSTLSKLAHPTFAGIIERHFVVDQQTNEFTVHVFRVDGLDSTNVIISTAVNLLKSIHEILNQKFPQKRTKKALPSPSLPVAG
jgi:Family of unknown function (DUF5677)